MNDLLELYNRYHDIRMNYDGQKTNWRKATDDLYQTYNRVRNTKIQASKNSSFYSWIKRQLQDELWNEYIRVEKLAITQEKAITGR